MMKKHGKIFAFLLAAVVTLTTGFSMTALAVEGDPAEGTGSAPGSGAGYSITVDKNFKGQEYTLYKLFNATTNAERQGKTDADSETSVTANGIAYTLIDETDHALNKEFTVTKSDGTQAVVKAEDWFEYVNGSNKNIKAKAGADITTELFRLWAKAYGVKTQETLTAARDDDPSIQWTGLEDGYYYITTTTGTLVTVDSIAPNAIVKDKNTIPTIDKTVQEDSRITGSGSAGDGVTGYQKQNDVDLGQTVYFKTVIKAKKGASGYVLYDRMDKEFTFGGIGTIAVYKGTVDDDHKLTVNTDYVVEAGGDYYTAEGVKDGTAAFRVTFQQSFLDKITEDTDLIVLYSAALNEDAVINTPVENGSILQYGNSTFTEESITKTYTWGIDLYKYAGVISQGSADKGDTPLSGAKFVLYKLVDGKIRFANFTGSSPDYTLKVTPAEAWIDAAPGTTEASLITAEEGSFNGKATLVESDAEGKINLKGLDADTYYLVEVTAPKGYNKLASKITVTVDSDSDLDDAVTGDQKHHAEDIVTPISLKNDTDANGSVHADVRNNEGTVLPSTGGRGTAVFYILGSILVIGAGVLLVARRRMKDQ